MTKEELRIPFWDTDCIFDESLLMVRDKNGIAAAPLFYEPAEIISVTDSKKEIEYTEGKDWTLSGKEIVLSENSRIFSFAEDEIYLKNGEAGKCFPIPDGYLLFSEGSFFIEKQIVVTYKCKDPDWDGVRPVLADKELCKTFKKLRNGEDLHLLLYGDSISAGANVTAASHLNISPYQPDYGTLLHTALSDHYGSKITFTNTSSGGKDSNWAIKNFEENVLKHNPDLMIIAFGMNDGYNSGVSPEAFGQNMRTMIELQREQNPDCEVILVATSLPNSILTDPKAPFWGTQEEYLPQLLKISVDTQGVAVANITDMHKTLLSRKRFIDMTSNNVNHPNDFLYRCYAQFISGMLTC